VGGRSFPRATLPRTDDANEPLEYALADPVDALILDLLEWIGPQPRAYSEVIDAWRTSCPRLPVWEEANDRGFVERQQHEGRGTFVTVTALGWEFLERHRPHRAARAGALD